MLAVPAGVAGTYSRCPSHLSGLPGFAVQERDRAAGQQRRTGQTRRWRPNVWTYPGASSFGFDARRGLKDHPTDKPTAMLDDALLDLSNRGDIVIDPFLGSGSPLIVELDLLYVYVMAADTRPRHAIQRVLLETGEAFDVLAARRSREAAPRERAFGTRALCLWMESVWLLLGDGPRRWSGPSVLVFLGPWPFRCEDPC